MNDFTKGNATRQIISFAAPMLMGNLVQQLYSIGDVAIVSRFIGGDALAAVGISIPLINFLLSIIIGLTTGASVLISQLFGAKREDDLKRAVSTSVLFMGGLTILVSIIGMVFARPLLRLLDTPPHIMDGALEYYMIILAGLILTLLFNVYQQYLRALGDSKFPLYFLTFSTILNVVLDLFMVGKWGMGLRGAAASTLIAQGVAAIPCLIYANKKVPLLRVNRWVLDIKLLKDILKYSVPAATQLSIVSFAHLTILRLVNGFGAAAIAGITMATRVDSFATMPLSSISAAISTFVAQNMGAKQLDRAKHGFRAATRLALLVGIVVSALAFVAGRPLMGVLVSPEEVNRLEIVSVGVKYLNIIAASYSLFAVFFALNGFFRGAGDAVVVMALTIISLSLRAICAHVLVYRFGFGPEAVACSVPVGWGLCALLGFIYYKRNMWAGKAVV